MFKKVVKEELTVLANNDSLKDLREFVTRIGKKYRFTDKLINAFKLAIDEASSNIIRHSYREKSGSITIRAIIRKESFTISLIDQGRYFDPTNVKDPDLKRYVAIGKKGGLGIFMIRKLVDDISYHRTDEGNELRLTKIKGVERKRSLNLLKVPGSMRIKYYTTSAAIVSTVVLVAYIYNFLNTDKNILDETYNQMDVIAGNFAQNVADDLRDKYASMGGIGKRARAVVEEDSSFVKFAVATSLDTIWGSSNMNWFPPTKILEPGITVMDYEQGFQLVNRGTLEIPNKQFFLIKKDVHTRIGGERELVGIVYLYFEAQSVFNSISQKRADDLKLAGLVLVLANLGIGFLIFLILTPLQKLSNWVRDMGQEDIRDKIDIDTSNEIGKIAQAFGDITDKFRESQRSLVDQERIQQEMHLAKEIQQTLLPAEFPEIKGYEIASYYESAKEVGGDYYDFVEVDRDRLGVVVADVSGKGVPGSLVMTMIRTALRTEARAVGSAAKVLTKVNNFVIGDIRKGMFVTLFYTILDSRKRRVTLASAGHNPLILYRASTQKTYYLNPKGFPVGISLHEKDLFQQSIEDDTIQLSKGDVILCYTDGITEAMNAKRELFGEERLLEVMREHGQLRAKHLVEKLKEELVAFTEGQIQNDDITFVVIKEKMSPEESDFERAKEIYYDMLNDVSLTEACETHGMPLSTFSQKYRNKLENIGVEEFKKEFETTSVEARHLSIEELTKIYDIIRKNPQWGAKRISDNLNIEEYSFTKIPEKRIYDELVRKRLNTRALREAYVSRGINKKRMKPPGTPMLTLDGQVIMDDQLGPKLHAPIIEDLNPKPVEKVEEIHPQKPVEVTKKKQPVKPIEEKEGAELILSDIVDLLDKGQKTDKKPPLIEEEIDDYLKPLELSEDETESDVEYDSDIKNLLENLSEGQGEEEQEPVDEIDFSDLSASEYSKDLFDDRTNGDKEDQEVLDVVETEPEPVSQNMDEYENDKKPESVLNELSISLDENSDGDGNSDFEDFEQLISGEELDLISEIEAEVDSEDTIQTQDTDNQETLLEKEPVLVDNTNNQKFTYEESESKPVNDVFDNLSIEVEEDVDVTIYNSEEQADTINEFFDLVSSEELNLQEEFGENGNKKSTSTKRKTEKQPAKNKEDNQQKMLIAGGHYYLQKKYDKAIHVFQKIIGKHPNNIEALYNLGNSYFRLRKFNEAQIAYEKVCNLDPTFLDAMENLGVIFANKKEYKEAIKIWKKILEFDPKREDIKKNIEKALRISRKI